MLKIKNIVIVVIIFTVHITVAQDNYEQYRGEKSIIKFSKIYPFANLYDYKINSRDQDSVVTKKLETSLPEFVLTEKYSDELSMNKKDSVVFALSLYSKLTIDLQNIAHRHCLIKYAIKKDNQLSEAKIIDVFLDGNRWKEYDKSSKELEALKGIMMNSTVSMLFDFDGERESNEFPEINELKTVTKNRKGVIDIVKLAKVLKENKNKLAKYLNQ